MTASAHLASTPRQVGMDPAPYLSAEGVCMNLQQLLQLEQMVLGTYRVDVDVRAVGPGLDVLVRPALPYGSD
jgi:hypothetical protein